MVVTQVSTPTYTSSSEFLLKISAVTLLPLVINAGFHQKSPCVNTSFSTGHTHRRTNQTGGHRVQVLLLGYIRHPCHSGGLAQPRKFENFIQIKPKMCKIVTYKVMSALYVFRPPKRMVLTCHGPHSGKNR